MYRKLQNRFSEITSKYVRSIPKSKKEQSDLSKLLKRNDFFSNHLIDYKNELRNASDDFIRENNIENQKKLNELIHDEVIKFRDIVLLEA